MSCANHADVEEALRTCAHCGAEFCADCVVVLQGEILCARCKEDRLLDLLSGVRRGLTLASWRRRVGALFIDRSILTILVIGLPLLLHVELSFIGGNGALFWMTYCSYIAYEGIMLRLRGQTLGKIITGVRVVLTDGSPLHAKHAWGRALLRGIFISALQIIDDTPALFTAEKTCIHDLLARTRVVEI